MHVIYRFKAKKIDIEHVIVFVICQQNSELNAFLNFKCVWIKHVSPMYWNW